jgi:hypothetical protein
MTPRAPAHWGDLYGFDKSSSAIFQKVSALENVSSALSWDPLLNCLPQKMGIELFDSKPGQPGSAFFVEKSVAILPNAALGLES